MLSRPCMGAAWSLNFISFTVGLFLATIAILQMATNSRALCFLLCHWSTSRLSCHQSSGLPPLSSNPSITICCQGLVNLGTQISMLCDQGQERDAHLGMCTEVTPAHSQPRHRPPTLPSHGSLYREGAQASPLLDSYVVPSLFQNTFCLCRYPRAGKI